MCLTFIPFGCALWYTNHEDGDGFWIDGEVRSDDIKWGAKVESKPKTKIDEGDPDYRASVRELENDLNQEKHFDKRLKIT